ncbi:hypothetical protein [Methanosarcina barkeri]|nr:hypothetical protein [Methanosarcina barkeri]
MNTTVRISLNMEFKTIVLKEQKNRFFSKLIITNYFYCERYGHRSVTRGFGTQAAAL